jgi:hypothetical protein
VFAVRYLRDCAHVEWMGAVTWLSGLLEALCGYLGAQYASAVTLYII